MRPLEGRISNRLYWGPKGASPLEVFRNYQHALTAAGFETLFVCEAQQCLTLKVQPMLSDLPRTADWIKGGDAHVGSTFNSGNQPGFHYISARKTVPGGAVHVQIALAGGSDDPPVSGRVRQMVQIVEPAKIDLGKVTVDAKTIQAGLQRDGKIALYGVLFDTNKAVLRPESAPQLAQMAQVLKDDPGLKAFIVGHTDNEGGLDANMRLSQKRAAAVVAELSGRYGVPAARLTAQGVANLVPVTTNSSAEGRAMNRRVELVIR
jgi:outer membrane protein OmpA-like peptidoglycan-associated protein